MMNEEMMKIVNESARRKKHEEYLHKKQRAILFDVLIIMAIAIGVGIALGL
jgi:hypothetical protein